MSVYHLRLYITGEAPHSVQASANLRELLRRHIPGRHRIEIVDILREPSRALEDNILLTPSLVKLSPLPTCQIIGNLSETKVVLQTLGLSPSEHET